MNEQIRKLYIQAINDTKHDPADDINVQIAGKLAELIVQECASMARVFQAHEYDFTGDLDLDKFMLRHFGVEE